MCDLAAISPTACLRCQAEQQTKPEQYACEPFPLSFPLGELPLGELPLGSVQLLTH